MRCLYLINALQLHPCGTTDLAHHKTQIIIVVSVGRCILCSPFMPLLSTEAITLSCQQRQLRHQPSTPLINVGPLGVQSHLYLRAPPLLSSSIGVGAGCTALLMAGLARLAHSCQKVNREQKYWSKRRLRCTALVSVFTALEVGMKSCRRPGLTS